MYSEETMIKIAKAQESLKLRQEMKNKYEQTFKQMGDETFKMKAAREQKTIDRLLKEIEEYKANDKK